MLDARSHINPRQRKLVTATRVLVCIALGVCAWIATTYFRGLLRLGYLDSGIGSVRRLVTAETKYAESHPNVGYSCEFSELGQDQMITALAKTRTWNEYEFELSGCSGSNGVGPNRSYRITARPLIAGLPALCSDQSGVLKTDYSASIPRCIASGTPL